MARVFTGWAFHTTDIPNTSFWYGPIDWINPMTNFPDYHDTDAKNGQVHRKKSRNRCTHAAVGIPMGGDCWRGFPLNGACGRYQAR